MTLRLFDVDDLTNRILPTDGTPGQVPKRQADGSILWEDEAGGDASGPAGGVLSGTYPNPSFAADMATQAELDAHTGASDPHTQYQLESEKGSANGYASLGASAFVPMSQLASGTPDGTKFVRDDNTLAAPPGSSAPFPDNAALVKDDVDATKLLRVDVGTVATGTTRVLTMPNADVNLGNLVSNARRVDTTAPLTGGGDLTADKTLAISAATTSAAGSMSAADKTKLDAWGTNSNFWHAYQSVAQTDLVASGSGSTRLTFTTLENAAYNGGGNYSTSTSLFTAPAAGLYMVGGACILTPGTAPTAGQFSQLIASINDADSYVIQRSFSAGTATSAIFAGGSVIIAVSASNTISLRLLHSLSGTAGTLPDTLAAASTTYFWGMLLRTF